MKTTLKKELVNCIKSYVDKKYDISFGSRPNDISIYYMLGYLGHMLGKKVVSEISEYLEKAHERR